MCVGVESVETNLGNGQVTVKGVVDPEKLVDEVYKKTRKAVSIVKDEEKKEEENKKEEEKEGEKKDNEGGNGEDEDEDEKKLDIKRSEYWTSKYYLEYAYDPPPDQFFSDENPNACFIM